MAHVYRSVQGGAGNALLTEVIRPLIVVESGGGGFILVVRPGALLAGSESPLFSKKFGAGANGDQGSAGGEPVGQFFLLRFTEHPAEVAGFGQDEDVVVVQIRQAVAGAELRNGRLQERRGPDAVYGQFRFPVEEEVYLAAGVDVEGRLYQERHFGLLHGEVTGTGQVHPFFHPSRGHPVDIDVEALGEFTHIAVGVRLVRVTAGEDDQAASGEFGAVVRHERLVRGAHPVAHFPEFGQRPGGAALVPADDVGVSRRGGTANGDDPTLPVRPHYRFGVDAEGRGDAVGFQVVGQGSGPSGHIVHHAVFDLKIAAQDGVHEQVARLLRPDDEAAGGERTVAALTVAKTGGGGSDLLFGAQHFDAVEQQHFQDVLEKLRAVVFDHVGVNGGFGVQRVPGFQAVINEFAAVAGGGLHLGDAGGVVIVYPLAQGENVAVFGFHGAVRADAALLGQHTDSAHHGRVAGTIAGVVKVEAVAGEIAQPFLVELGNVGAAEGIGPDLVGFGEQEVARGGAGYGEVVGVVALLVVVGVYLRHPLLVGGRVAPAFGVYAPHPIAVQVEPVVVGAAVGPGGVVFQVARFLAAGTAGNGVGPVDVAVTAVGVDANEKQVYRFAESVQHYGVVRSGQLPGELHGGLGAARFVAVDVVAVAVDDGVKIEIHGFLTPTLHLRARHQNLLVGFDLVDARHVLT